MKGVQVMPFEVIVPKGSPPPLAPYSPGAKAGNAVYVSGALALDSQGKLVGAGDVKAQTRQVLETIKGPRGGWRLTEGRHLQSHLLNGYDQIC